MVDKLSFGREEKLKSRKQIDELFAGGKHFTVAPIRVSYRLIPSQDEVRVQAGVTVSKRNFKRAVDRNRIKRLLRESYRLQKNSLIESSAEKKLSCHVFFMYVAKDILPFDIIRQSMHACLMRLQKSVNENLT